ncbi:molybdate ABC transporter substrate-binding protein [Psychrobacter sp. 1U2]|uniref:molybdate ABC transporter substrate-binding protein n=1 Tax=Psychrobacter sp. 1U2 TaxID=3453577 RepID=UPI003F47391C
MKTIVITVLCLAVTLTACGKDSAIDKPESTQTLRIAAAANLSDVLPKVVEGYKIDNHLPALEIEVTYASSGKLYAQIISGAPYDIFLSANQEFPAKLAAEILTPDKATGQKGIQPFTYTQGQLALYSVVHPLNALNPSTLNELLMAKFVKVTIANPQLAPYGDSAKAFLQSQNSYDSMIEQKRLIQAENIGQAFQYVHTGSVDYGFVAQAQLTAIKAKPEQFYTLAPTSYPPILQDGIVLSDRPVAHGFSEYLRYTAGQQYFSAAGYLPVQ